MLRKFETSLNQDVAINTAFVVKVMPNFLEPDHTTIVLTTETVNVKLPFSEVVYLLSDDTQPER